MLNPVYSIPYNRSSSEIQETPAQAGVFSFQRQKGVNGWEFDTAGDGNPRHRASSAVSGRPDPGAYPVQTVVRT